MTGRAPKDRSAIRQAQQLADDKTSSAPCSKASNEVMHYAGHKAPVGYRRMRFIRTVSAVLAICILLLFSTCSLESWFLPPLPTPNGLLHYPRQATKATNSALLEVVQAYPPVLTVALNGSLELTDGSPNATVQLIDNNAPVYQEILAVYSFAQSYGHPFVGEYTPPNIAFNRVTWNLTVVSAGRQFDRLGIVYLGDVEVFRTSTAEPTAGGIEWTYLKVSLS